MTNGFSTGSVATAPTSRASPWDGTTVPCRPTAIRNPSALRQLLVSDTGDPDALHELVSRLSSDVSRSLERRELHGRTVKLKLRLSDFTTFTRQVTLPDVIQSSDQIAVAASRLMDAEIGPGSPDSGSWEWVYPASARLTTASRRSSLACPESDCKTSHKCWHTVGASFVGALSPLSLWERARVRVKTHGFCRKLMFMR